ncbi:ABC transporter ATP-binding protein [Halomarina pelagica]|uniref:ABC transporter ATP-binding protein n=1 Tax=Halomarina pelagica TaxID=2961599 RepID=UPI0020C4E45E|nr:ABC transporter ATP-binding protein [Halomarina sp. BND7]
MTLLDVHDLDVRYDTGEGTVHAVDGVSFSVDHGETFGLVGESGSGKTTLGMAILQLLDRNGRIASGEVWFDAVPPAWEGPDGSPRPEVVEDDRYPVREDGMVNLAALSDELMRDLRWRNVALVPQSAMNALNPVYRVGDQITEAIHRHEPGTSQSAADERARDLLERVGIDPDRADDYAHQYSGGMKQRAVIAMAIACDPDLLIADEPTTGLDVIVQDRLLDELDALQAEFDLSILVVSHDISVMSDVCDRLAVMYGGKIMESGTTREVIAEPANPYTLGLKNAFPTVSGRQKRLVSIPGTPPTLREPPQQCQFIDRCPFAVEECETAHPPSYDVEEAGGGAGTGGGRPDGTADDRTHRTACYRVNELDAIRARASDEETWRALTDESR